MMSAQHESVPEALREFLPDGRIENDRLTLTWHERALRSVFQPIVSFCHSRVVGHEGLIRVSDAAGNAISPPEFLREADAAGELPRIDRACRLMHAWNARTASGYLFLNLHPALFGRFDPESSARMVDAMTSATGLPAHRCMIEVVEETVADLARLEAGAATLRELGLGLALDDFGAGHSNFDRVWRIRPDVVKLDGSFTRRALYDDSARRMLPRIVSILHEAGALVLLEGIETMEQALIAMDADIDLGQGWYFARPAPEPLGAEATVPALDALWDGFNDHSLSDARDRQRRIAPFLNAVGYAAVLLASGIPLASAARSFFELGSAAECFYLLDAEGRQIGTNVSNGAARGKRVLLELGRLPGARWSRRSYFQRAVQHPGKPQVTRPYVSMSSGNTCVTVSVHLRLNGADCVLCGDVDWELLEGRPSGDRP